MRTVRWLAIPFLAAAMLIAACGGDEDSGEDGGTDAETTATESASESTTEATETATADATEASEGGGDDAADLAEIFAGFETATFNVTYTMESDAATEGMSGDWTWIQDSEGDRTRFEATSDGQSVIMITTAEQTLICAEDACFDAGGAMGGAVPNIGDALNESIDDVESETATAEVRRIDDREIAGTNTQCVEFEDSAEGVTGVACYTEDGVPLLIESDTAEGQFRMEATEYSTDVSDDLFEAPFPVTSLGG